MEILTMSQMTSIKEALEMGHIYELWFNSVDYPANTCLRYGVELYLESDANEMKHLLYESVLANSVGVACRIGD